MKVEQQNLLAFKRAVEEAAERLKISAYVFSAVNVDPGTEGVFLAGRTYADDSDGNGEAFLEICLDTAFDSAQTALRDIDSPKPTDLN